LDEMPCKNMFYVGKGAREAGNRGGGPLKGRHQILN